MLTNFKDVDALGVFVDNHDNARFLNRYKDNMGGLMRAQTYAMSMSGIPITYYGTEQFYSGANDPENRESFWQSKYTQSDFYKMIAVINAQRKASKIWEHEYKHQVVDSNWLAFSRGEFLVVLTNTDDFAERFVGPPFEPNTTVCNIFKPTTDCLQVPERPGVLKVKLHNGEPKIYVPQDKLAPEVLQLAEQSEALGFIQ